MELNKGWTTILLLVVSVLLVIGAVNGFGGGEGGGGGAKGGGGGKGGRGKGTAMTAAAASRIQSAAAKAGGVEKGSFAARTQSAAARNANNGQSK